MSGTYGNIGASRADSLDRLCRALGVRCTLVRTPDKKTATPAREQMQFGHKRALEIAPHYAVPSCNATVEDIANEPFTAKQLFPLGVGGVRYMRKIRRCDNWHCNLPFQGSALYFPLSKVQFFLLLFSERLI